jgi:hypothetical protein
MEWVIPPWGVRRADRVRDVGVPVDDNGRLVGGLTTVGVHVAGIGSREREWASERLARGDGVGSDHADRHPTGFPGRTEPGPPMYRSRVPVRAADAGSATT